MAKQDRFVFRKLDNIGAADAEEDKAFLKECFVEHGYLEVLRDDEETGSGLAIEHCVVRKMGGGLFSPECLPLLA
jgi:hypothetical protein